MSHQRTFVSNKMNSFSWLKVTQMGLYCVPGDFYLDPLEPVARALISHAHSDHARAGHQKVLATKETLTIMTLRYGADFAAQKQSINYGKPLNIKDVIVTFLPAGHILGSAQIKMSYQNSTIIFSGDYKRQYDPTCLPFEVSNCDVFITETTYGLPIFIQPPIEHELTKLITSLQTNSNRCHLLAVYVLGKCQRILLTLRALGYDKPIYVHGGLLKLSNYYERLGFDLGELIQVTPENAPHLQGELVLCPPMALRDRWTRKLPNVLPAYASGWMQTRARAKQKGVELPLIISDHADWLGLTETIHEVNASEIWLTHGDEEALAYFSEQEGYMVRKLSSIRYEDERED